MCGIGRENKTRRDKANPGTRISNCDKFLWMAGGIPLVSQSSSARPKKRKLISAETRT